MGEEESRSKRMDRRVVAWRETGKRKKSYPKYTGTIRALAAQTGRSEGAKRTGRYAGSSGRGVSRYLKPWSEKARRVGALSPVAVSRGPDAFFLAHGPRGRNGREKSDGNQEKTFPKPHDLGLGGNHVRKEMIGRFRLFPVFQARDQGGEFVRRRGRRRNQALCNIRGKH